MSEQLPTTNIFQQYGLSPSGVSELDEPLQAYLKAGDPMRVHAGQPDANDFGVLALSSLLQYKVMPDERLQEVFRTQTEWVSALLELAESNATANGQSIQDTEILRQLVAIGTVDSSDSDTSSLSPDLA